MVAENDKQRNTGKFIIKEVPKPAELKSAAQKDLSLAGFVENLNAPTEAAESSLPVRAKPDTAGLAQSLMEENVSLLLKTKLMLAKKKGTKGNFSDTVK